MMTTADLPEALATLVGDVAADVDVWRLDRAYLTAGGPLLTVASRLGFPQADLFLEFTLAVRALLRDNADAEARDKARAHYERTLARVQAALDGLRDNLCPECEQGIVVAGPMEGDTGHVTYACTRCSFSG